jgi:hypothetical protein
MAVSQEELVMHDCQVVCPQCLAICQYEGGVLVVRDDSDAPYRHTASASPEAPQHETSRETLKKESKFCHSCGKQLPAGIRFCPYCGADLNAPFDEEPKPIAPVVQPAPEPQQPKVQRQQQRQEPVKEKKRPEPTPTPEPPVRQETPSQVEDKLRTMSHRYKSTHPQLHQNGTMPSTTFKIVAYVIIALLLALLIYIIIVGASIEPAI